MLRPLCLAAALTFGGTALAQTTPPPDQKPAVKKGKAQNASSGDAPTPSTSTKTGSQGSEVANQPAAGAPTAAPGPSAGSAPDQSASSVPGQTASPAKGQGALPTMDQEEFRRQVMEEVRRELQKAKDEVKQETAWVAQDSQARVQDSEAVQDLKTRVNLFQPHGYLRMRGEFFNNMKLGLGPDPSGNFLFGGPYIGAPPGSSQSDANFRFRFEPTVQVSEDIAIHFQADMLDNILLGSDPVADKFLDPFTPLNVLANSRVSSVVNVKRVWGEVNTALGEFLFGRMGYNWGLGMLHNDGNCLDCDFGDTADRIAFAPREFKGHHFTAMFDLLDKGPSTEGPMNDLGRPIDLDTLDDGYRVAVQVTHVDTAEEIKRKLDAQQWVFNYGLVLDYAVQGWQAVETNTASPLLRTDVARRGAKFTEPDFFISLKRKKYRLDAEFAAVIGNIDSHAQTDAGLIIGGTNAQQNVAAVLSGVSFLQFGGALQFDYSMLSADALQFGFDAGAASGDKGAFGFGARPYRNGSGNLNGCGSAPAVSGTSSPCFYQAAGRGDIDGSHIDFPTNGAVHGRVNNFVFNRDFNVDMILFRNLISSVTSSWYVKPSMRWRPTGRRSGGGDDSGFELLLSAMYAQAWFKENTPGLHKPLGVELNAGITYDTSDRFHVGLAYGILIPFSGMGNVNSIANPGVAHSVRLLTAIPF
ncbi:MAG TPA: TIGR04551 family protein [Myxococcales bacterium]|jgi:uncharacterized protein (TIGR04551 family)